MFTKFLKSEECMTVLSWFINHPDGEYIASIVCTDCGEMSLGKFMAALTILDGVGFITVNELEEELMVSLNKDANITQLLIHLKDEFEDISFKEYSISSAFNYLYSSEFRRSIDKDIASQVVDWNEIIDLCKNYEDLDLNDAFQKEIHDLCVELDKNNELDGFIKHAQNELIKK